MREVGSETALWASAPLSEVGVAGGGGSSQPFGALRPPPAEDEEAAALRALAPTDAAPTAEDGSPQTASLTSCGWRLQRALPPITKFRTRPQALFYSASNDRSEFELRLNTWRRELKENQMTELVEVRSHIPDSPWRPLDDSVRTIPQSPSKWNQPWRPPPPPHHLRGDPLTQRLHAKYITDAAEDAARLRSQAVLVQLDRLYGALPICATADRACDAIGSLYDFLQTGDNLVQIDALRLLKKIKGLRLPFERLVRNVWTAGPEVEYDKAKVAITRLLQREVALRKAAGSPQPRAQPDVEPKQISPMIQADMATVKFKPPVYGSKTGLPPPPKLGRAGLLTFKGKPM